MKRALTLAGTALILAGCTEGKTAPMSISIATLHETGPATQAKARWVEADDDSWRKGDPSFEAKSEKTDLAARGWVAVTDDELRLRVRIDDPQHIGAPDTVQLWAGDGIEVCVDARGDAVGKLPKDTPGVFGPDDAKFMVAITPKGPIGRCFAADRDENRGDLPAEWVAAERDDAANTTTYELRVPWTRFETRPGLFPSFGLAIQFNDLDPGSKERTIINWGTGTFGAMRPGLSNRVAVEPPARTYSASVVNSEVLWTSADEGEVVLAIAGAGSYKVEATLRDEKLAETIEVSDKLQRVAVNFAQSADGGLTDVPFSVRLSDASGRELESRSGTLKIVEEIYQSIYQILDARLAEATQPLYRRHLISIKALVAAERARMTLYHEYGTRGNAHETFKFVRKIHNGLEAGRGTWKQCRRGEADLYMSYVSRQDRTVQFYVLSLPKDWDETKAYPLFVELHGAGNQNFMSDLAARLGADDEAIDLKGYTDRRTYVQRMGAGYWIMPSGRGNLGYRGPGEEDVWEAYDDVHRLFKIDEDRRYLFGFSMGGGGTWSLGTRTPDRWAALMIMAGGMWRESTKLGLGRNVSYLPVYVWCGEEDSLCERYFPQFKQELERFGNKPQLKTVPGLGHSYTAEIQKECAEWLVKHTRARPKQFSFVADTDEHRGAWGITMTRDLSASGAPSFMCQIDGATVRIKSEGAPGLEVKLDEGGLELSGEVAVEWNGDEAYKGPAKTITLGEVPRRRRRR